MSKTGMPKRRSRASLVVAAGLCGALAFGGATAAYASDIQGHWNEAGMQEWIDYGILKGYDNGDYGPDNPTTRAELVAFLDRVMDYQKTADNSFSDLDKNWYTEVVLKGVAAGVIAGDDAGTMRPNDPVTREEAATIFARVLALDVDNAKPSKFSDASKVHSWAKGSVDAMVEAGYINGYPDGTFGPTQAITRAEVIGMLNNMFADLYQKSGTYSDGSDSSAVISAGDVVLKDEVVDGDLVIAEGVANGHVVLDGVTVKGKLIVRGGGANSVVIKGKSSIGTILVDRQDSKVRVAVEGAAKVDDVVVADDTASVKVEGEVGTVTVEASKAKVEVAASVDKIVVPADGAQLTLTSKADVKSIAVAGDDVVVEAEKGAAVEKVVISGADATISGSGDVEAVEVAKGASGATVETEGTKVENNGTGAVTIPGGTIAEGGSATTPETTTPGGGGGGGTVVPVPDTSVKNEEQLKQQLADETVSTIKLGANITVTDQVDVSRAVTIDGQGKYTITSKNESANKAEAAGILVTADGVTLKGLTVSGPNKNKAEGQVTHWDEGQYGIKVYSANNVILQDVTVKDANAGIQVNSSKVTLKGKIDVSGNEFGGIEVCKSANEGLGDLALAIAEGATLANDSEDSSSNPTVWIDGYGEGSGKIGEGVVIGFTGQKVEMSDKGQLWFLLKAPSTADTSEGAQA